MLQQAKCNNKCCLTWKKDSFQESMEDFAGLLYLNAQK